jgi:branched-chain amino acid transport system ATP-binding protein
MAGLGSGESHAILELIKEKRRVGLGIIVIEHRLPELMSISDRMIVLHAGSSIAEGAPDEVVRDPEVIRVYLGIGAAAAPRAPSSHAASCVA